MFCSCRSTSPVNVGLSSREPSRKSLLGSPHHIHSGASPAHSHSSQLSKGGSSPVRFKISDSHSDFADITGASRRSGSPSFRLPSGSPSRQLSGSSLRQPSGSPSRQQSCDTCGYAERSRSQLSLMEARAEMKVALTNSNIDQVARIIENGE